MGQPYEKKERLYYNHTTKTMRITSTMLLLLLSGIAFSQTQSQEAANEASESKKVQVTQQNSAASVRKAPVRVKKVEATEQPVPQRKEATIKTTENGGK